MLNASGVSSLVSSPTVLVRPRIVAALLSAFFPGIGHLYLKRPRPAAIMLATFACILVSGFLFRASSSYLGFAFQALTLLALIAAASCTALMFKEGEVRLSWWWLLVGIAIGLGGFSADWNLVVRGSGFRNFTVSSTSMERAVFKDDMVMADLRAYRKSAPAHGDVIVFKRSDGIYYCKRVVATADETIEGRNGDVYLNRVKLEEPYVRHSDEPGPAFPELRTFGPLKVPAGELFVMGDSRDYSIDSRMNNFGLVNAADAGKILYVLRSKAKERIGKEVK